MRKVLVLLASMALMLVPFVANAQTPTPTPTPPVVIATPDPLPPSALVQICAATDIEAVDAILASVAETALVGELSPLLDLTVPSNPNGVELDADVTLAEARDALNCEPDDTATPTTPPATTTPGPSLPEDEDDDTPVTRVPRGGVDTGGWAVRLS